MNNDLTGFTRRLQIVPAALMALAALLFIFPSVVRPQATQVARPDAPPTLTLTAPSLNTTVGATFTIPVTVGDTTGLGVIAYQFILNFNPAVIQPQAVPVSTVGTLSEGMAVTYNTSTPGVMQVDAFTATDREGAGVLFNLRFKAVGPLNSSSPVTWQTFMFNEGDPQKVSTNGLLTIVGPTASGTSVSGRLLSAAGQPVSNARVILTEINGKDRAVLSNGFGYYEFGDLESGKTYVVSVETRRFSFPSRVMTAGSDVLNFDLTADQ